MPLYDIFTDSFLLDIRFTRNRKYLRIILRLTIHTHKIRILVVSSYEFYENTITILTILLRIALLISSMNKN